MDKFSRRQFLKAASSVAVGTAVFRRRPTPGLAAEFAGPLDLPTGTFGYEEGTAGAAVGKRAFGVLASSGKPIYSSEAAKHGAFGVAPAAGGAATLTYALPATVSSTGSIYARSVTRGSASSRIVMLKDRSTVLARLLLLPGGGIGLAGPTGAPIATSTRKDALDTWTRIDWQTGWDGATLSVRVRYFPVDAESSFDYQHLSGTLACTSAPSTAVIGSSSGAWTVYFDTLRLYDTADAWPGPYASFPSVAFALPGIPTSSSVTISTLVTGTESIDMAISSNADLSSATYVGASTLDSDCMTQLSIEGITNDSVYYARLAITPGQFIGDTMRFRTLPSTDAGTPLTRRIAFGSCQTGGDTDIMGSQTDYPQELAWRDQEVWGADDTINVGDFGYFGAQVETQNGVTPDYRVHTAQYAHQMATMPVMRRVMAKSGNVFQRDDHDISGNNGQSYENPVSTQSVVALQKIYGSPALGDAGDQPRGRYFSYTYGGQIRVIVTDGMSLDRSISVVGQDGMDPTATFFGAVQLAWIEELLLGPECLKIVVSGKSLLGDPPAFITVNDQDKLWAYGYERQALMQFIASHQTYAGDPIYCEWWGGDRHALAYVSAAGNPLGPISVLVSSGYSMHGLRPVSGEESYEWSAGFDAAGKQWVAQWMQITLEDDGAGIITRTAQTRLTDCRDRSRPMGRGWTIADGPTFVDTWTYAASKAGQGIASDSL